MVASLGSIVAATYALSLAGKAVYSAIEFPSRIAELQHERVALQAQPLLSRDPKEELVKPSREVGSCLRAGQEDVARKMGVNRAPAPAIKLCLCNVSHS